MCDIYSLLQRQEQNIDRHYCQRTNETASIKNVRQVGFQLCLQVFLQSYRFVLNVICQSVSPNSGGRSDHFRSWLILKASISLWYLMFCDSVSKLHMTSLTSRSAAHEHPSFLVWGGADGYHTHTVSF